MDKKIKIILPIALIIIMILTRISFAISNNSSNDNKILTLSKSEVAPGENVELNIDISKIESDKFEIIIYSNNENGEISTNELSEKNGIEVMDASSNKVSINIDKQTFKLNNIKLEYQIPESVEIGSEITITIKVIKIDGNISDNADKNQDKDENKKIDENKENIDVNLIKNSENEDNLPSGEKQENSIINDNYKESNNNNSTNNNNNNNSNNNNNNLNNREDENNKEIAKEENKNENNETNNNEIIEENIKLKIVAKSENNSNNKEKNQNTKNTNSLINGNIGSIENQGEFTDKFSSQIDNNQSNDNSSASIKESNVSTSISTAKLQSTSTISSTNIQNSSSNSTTYNGSNNNYLSSLKIENYDLNTEFSKENETYYINVSSQESINVTATSESASAKVRITGNENIKEGQNKILISVTAENGNVRYYRIYVNCNINSTSSTNSSENTNQNGMQNLKSNSNKSNISSNSEITSMLEENTDLHTGYYLKEIFVQENQFVQKGENILEYTNGKYLVAPYDCYISELNLPDEGNKITNENYVKVQCKNYLTTQISVSEKYINNINIGDDANIKVSSLGTEYTGYVTNIASTGSSGKFIVTIGLKNDGNIKIGMSATTSLN